MLISKLISMKLCVKLIYNYGTVWTKDGYVNCRSVYQRLESQLPM